ncbi:thioredoxin [Candidatus Woesearchaeota archaeon CG08_land_8_20_14_0_20_47_9]|nr:MAG: thioredoxin [Candidatus Woesearchaeota archaeon CG10_big_fil_rev_8_21_14_0_10_47_5]PIO04036.1 MAG: thioredoxin [Candidatus Woesearchaeota archaeon CG08_land_8_20_14_0_20_47_9]
MSLTHLDSKNFEKEVAQSDKPVIIDFWAPWCGPCQMMAPVFEELSREYEGRLRFAKLNTDEEPELASRFSIRGIPCLIVVKAGREIDHIIGFMPKQQLKQQIDAILSRAL